MATQSPEQCADRAGARTRARPLPFVSFVVIGRNEEKHLRQCLDSVCRQDYGGPTEVIYVDGQSTDRSREIATGVPGVAVLSVVDGTPSAAKGRNCGWRHARGELIQFVDGDAALRPAWTAHAVAVLEAETAAAVFGHFEERHPEHSLYNRVLGMDWPRESGTTDTFGGIVMIRRRHLMDTGGFPEDSQTGEDPLLALELRGRGHAILQTAEPMADHDLDILDFATYWRRSVRTGVAFAEMLGPKRKLGVALHRTRTARNLGCAAALIVLFAAAWIWPWVGAVAVALAVADMTRLTVLARPRAASWPIALAYAVHLRLSMAAETVGFFRWLSHRRRTTRN